MYRQFSDDIAEKSQESPQSATWLFAQQLLGNPVPTAATAAADPRARQEHLEWLASISPEHERQLRRAQQAQADAQAQRERLQWLATISERHETELRRQLRIEAEAHGEQDPLLSFVEGLRIQTVPWDPTKHPRRGTPPNPGWFATTGGPKSSSEAPVRLAAAPPTQQVARKQRPSLTDQIIKRNLQAGELTGVVTPGMIRSSRMAAELQAAARMAVEVPDAAAAGLHTGSKAVVNGTATTIKSAATLGLNTSQLELIAVTKEDRDRGYDTAVAISTASGQVLVAVGTGGIASTLSKGGTVARSASGALIAYDTAGNAVGVVQGTYDAATNGVNLHNGAQVVGSALGLSVNAKTVQTFKRNTQPKSTTPDAVSPNVEDYIKTAPRTATPTTKVANQYEITQTGPYNYEVSGGGASIRIDGYRETTILEA